MLNVFDFAQLCHGVWLRTGGCRWKPSMLHAVQSNSEGTGKNRGVVVHRERAISPRVPLLSSDLGRFPRPPCLLQPRSAPRKCLASHSSVPIRGTLVYAPLLPTLWSFLDASRVDSITLSTRHLMPFTETWAGMLALHTS